MPREADQVRLPEGNRFTPEGAPNKPFHDRISGRILIGLLCSSIVFVAFNFGGVKTVLRFVFSAGNHVMGEPEIVEKAEKKLGKVLDKLDDLAMQNNPHTLPVHLPVNPVTKAVNETKQAVTDTVDEVKKVGGMITPAAQKAMEALRERQAKQEAARDAQIRVEARELGIEYDETTPIEELAAKIHAIKSASAKAKHDAFLGWWDANGPNGYCPKRHPMRVSRAGNAVHICPRCGAHARASAIRAAGDPPMPKQYPSEFELWWSKQ